MSRFLLPVISLVAFTLLLSLSYSIVIESGPARLYVDPESIIDYSYEPGTVFTIAVSLASVSDLYRCEFNMTYDNSVLGCLGVLIGPVTNVPIDPDVGSDDNRGNIWFDVSYQIPITTNSTVTLSTIYFLVKTRGETQFDFYYSHLLDSLENEIAHEVSNGYFRNFNPYDLNLDEKVDMKDIAIAAQAYGSYPGHPRWNPDADVDDDNDVDLFDLSLIAAHFGET